jgi:hypothetical protein
VTDEELSPALRQEVDNARAMRERIQEETRSLEERHETEFVPLWERIEHRRTHDAFGDEIQESMTRRRTA